MYEMNFFDKLSSIQLLEQNFCDFNSQKEKSNMVQALKKSVTKSELTKNLPPVNTKEVDSEQLPEATISNVDQRKVFSRFLEASCDCC